MSDKEYGYVRWQLLTLLNSLGLHEGTVRQLRRVVDRRAVDSRARIRDEAR